jgi:hypothetical protein
MPQKFESSTVALHCFCSFPLSDKNLLAKWMSAVNVSAVTKSSKICSDHFTQDSFCEVFLF